MLRRVISSAEMSEQQDQGGELIDPALPADQGLSSLGLLMQLAGNVFAAYAAMMAFAMLFALRGSGETLWVVLVLGLSVARSLFHRAAGVQLLYGNAPRSDGQVARLAGIHAYIAFAFVQTVLVCALLQLALDAPTRVTFAFFGALALWPATLMFLLQLPRFRRYRLELPETEDKGFEGASILMAVFGATGLIAIGTLLVGVLDLPAAALVTGPSVLLLGALGLLVARAVLHLQAGLAGLRETRSERSVELANRYATFGVLGAFGASTALLLLVFAGARIAGGFLDGVVGIALVGGVCWMLLAWPLIVRRFFTERQFSELLATDGVSRHRRAPDAGLTALGWLLLSHAVLGGAYVIIALPFDGYVERELSAFTAIGGVGGTRSLWWSVVLVLVEGWAGCELICASRRARIVASVFGVAGAVLVVYISWPTVAELQAARYFFGNLEAFRLGPIAMSLVIPIATLLLVNRKIAPTARARFRKPA